MDNSPFSGIDQEPNGRPAPFRGPEKTVRGVERDWRMSLTDELAVSRMDEEGAAQSHPRRERIVSPPRR